MKFNIVSKEGERVSVTVFHAGKSHVATSAHPSFGKICDALTSGSQDADKIVGLFDVGVGLGMVMEPLSERVRIGGGVIYFDGDPVHGALAEAILRFHAEGNAEGDYMALVNFMEKVATNPNDHSREQLFSWLSKHNFGICPDGDFIAYKSVETDGKSSRSGPAIVNGQQINGRIPNAPDTIIEMPRSKVHHDPKNGCSSGLHVANWHYASTWLGRSSPVFRVKINPRDVVSVPTDSGGEKMRVCRYRVVNRVTAEDTGVLFVPPIERIARAWSTLEETKAAAPVEPDAKAPAAKKPAVKRAAKKAPQAEVKAPKVAKPMKFPRYYEQFTKEHFEALDYSELRWLAKEWGLATRADKAGIVARLVLEAKKRLRTW